MTFEDVLLMLATKHQKFKGGGYTDLIQFNQYKRRISNGKIVLMDNGKVIPQVIKIGEEGIELTEDMELYNGKCENTYAELERLYSLYKNSVPSPYSDYGRSVFKSLALNELGHKLDGLPREIARIQLEWFVMKSEFQWENEKHHYWQSKSDKDLIIYKEWSKGL